MKALQYLLAILLLTGCADQLAAQESQSAKQESAHHSAVNARGDHAMGFSHEKTTHHFRLKNDGGAIEVTANDPADESTKQQIRMHLSHITHLFANGDFSAPMFIHDVTPPGVPAMKELKKEISYRFEELKDGGRVAITSQNAKAVTAIHQFLVFQIEDHQTGDSKQIDDK